MNLTISLLLSLTILKIQKKALILIIIQYQGFSIWSEFIRQVLKLIRTEKLKAISYNGSSLI